MRRRRLLRTITIGWVGLTAACLSSPDEPDSFGDIAARGEADPIAVEGEPTTEYEYRPDSETVVFEDGDEMYSVPFPEWGTREGAAIASGAVEASLSEADIDTVRVAPGRVSAEWISTEEPIDRDSDLGVVVENVGEGAFDAVVTATPRHVTATVTLPEREYTTTVPTLCRGEEP